MSRPFRFITQHAYARVQERLNVGQATFQQWAEATCPDWIQVNARWCRERQVTVSQFQSLWVTCWTFNQNLCLVVSADGAIKTVIPFFEKAGSPLAPIRPAPEHCITHAVTG